MHKHNSFLTLTYDDEHLPKDSSLDVSHWQDFAKRLRYSRGPFRYYHCGEYGPLYGRPHLHSLMFGISFYSDQWYWKTENGHCLYRSDSLEKTWGHGIVAIGELNYATAMYTASYTQKKLYGDQGKEHYQRVDASTGEITPLKPPYSTMSRRPGLGRSWYEKYRDDLYPDGYAVINGFKCRIPKYYDALYDIENPVGFSELQERRQKHSRLETPERLSTIEELKIRTQKFNQSRAGTGLAPEQ